MHSARYGARAALLNLCLASGLTFGLAVSVAAEPPRLVALGDSLTAGYGLAEPDGFVPQLQAWLAAAGRDVVVINAGVSGDTTAGGRARLDWTLSEPADAMIVILGGNDLLRGIDPASSRASLDAILTGAAARGLPVLLVPMEAPGNYGPDYRRDFDAMYGELATTHGALLAEPFLKPLVRGESDLSLARDLMQADGIHPNRDGVAKIVEGLGPKVLELLDRAAGS